MRYLFYLCGVMWLLSACSSRYYMRQGNMIYESGRYYKAASKFEKAYHKAKPKSVQRAAALCAAEAYEEVNLLKEAYSWYKRAGHVDQGQPEIYLKLAQVCVNLDDMETARQYYREYEEIVGDGKGQDGLYYLEQLIKDQNIKGRYIVQLKRVLNSRNSDFSPVYSPDDTCTVYFASTRNANPKRRKIAKDPITGYGYSHIYRSEYVSEIRNMDKKGQVRVKQLKKPRWLQPVLVRDSLYSNGHEGALCFTSDGQQVYFTSSRTVKGSHVGTRIYKAGLKVEIDDNGMEQKHWTAVAFAGICGDTVSVGHPALTPDGNRMYFVSDALPGGLGGKDIWYVEWKEGKWGQPINAGELVNSAGDEMFPYIRENGELYFASNGHYGFGGLDLYKVEHQEGREVLVHLPAPLNSFADDFGIVFQPGQENGLLTSARAGRSDNIFEFHYVPQRLKASVSVINTVTEQPVIQANIHVVADDGTEAILMTDSVGRASMVLAAEREYVFISEEKHYLKGKAIVSTYHEKSDKDYELVIGMQPIEKPIVIPNIYFDVAKWDLRPDAMKNLGKLLEILKDNPNITIELSAHTDMVGDDESNMKLSKNRAQAVVDYLMAQGVYWDRLEARGYGETQPRRMNEKDARKYAFLKAGDVLNEQLINHLNGQQKEIAQQLNRRIEFKVLRTDYKPNSRSLHNPNPKAVSAEKGVETLGNTQLRPLSGVKGKFYTLQLGVFKNVPQVIRQFRIVFTEKLKNGVVRYCTGVYDTRTEAMKAAEKLKQKGIDCLIKEFNP